MKRHSLLHIVSMFLLLNSVCYLSSCNEEGLESFEAKTPASTHTCRMTFDVDFTGFDAQDGTTRASILGWDDGDIVYLSFTTSGNGTVGGSAIYDAANNDWTVTYTGTLSSTEQGSVKVYYYDGEVTKSGNTLSIDPTVGVYADLKGSYKYSNENGVNVSASLSPQTSRIRFKGDPGKNITVSGINSYTEFDQQSGTLTSTPISSSVTVSSDGFTPYIYGVFADTSKPSISIHNDGCRFTKECSGSVFQVGISGWMNVPSRSAHENWEMEEIYKAHVVLTDSDKDGVGETLIFYYDDEDHTQEGMVFELNIEESDPEWLEYNENITNVIFDSGFAYARPTTTQRWFFWCTNLTSISGLNYLDTSEVTRMNYMFAFCYNLARLDVSGFNTAAVTSMDGMFGDCSKLTSLDVSSFNTSSVITMNGMFGGLSSLTSLDVSSFNTSAVTDMSYMFAGCLSLTSLDLGNFNTSAVIDMNHMFWGSSSLTSLDLSSFNTAAVVDMSNMFYYCSSLTSLDLGSFNTSSVTNMYGLFGHCSSLTSLDLSSFNTAAVKDMAYMFNECSSLTSLDLSNFDTSAVTRMAAMFCGCSGLASLDVSSFNTAAVINMDFMFYWCSGLTSLDISSFIVSSESTIDSLFGGCKKISIINVGSNDFSGNDFSINVFYGVGSSSNPSNLIIDAGFDKSVLGYYNGRYYYWRGGYFAEPIKCECVDLGLPSGTLWATFNVGASKPEEYGDYYRFGEIETRDYYSIDNYNDDYSSMLSPILYKSDSYLASLKNEYDVANVKWGNCWNLPSMKQIEELFCYCSAESELFNGVLCTKMTGPNGNYIYLPLNGYYSEGTIIGKATEGRYQCGEAIVTLDNNRRYNFITLKVNKDNVNYGVHEKAISGLGVRPVQRPRQEILPTSATIDKDNVQMQVGETITLTSTIYPENATYKYGIWSTYDDQIVSIDKFTGKVTAKSSGTAKVYFSDSYQYLFEAICTIIVK